MAVPSILDVATRQDPDGRLARLIIEQLAQTDGILDDIYAEECNDGSGHKTTIRTGLPTGTWRQLYQGVQPSKSTTAQVRDACGMLEYRSEIDVKLQGLRAGGDIAKAFRQSEEEPFRQALKNDVISTLFYGNASITPSKFTGIAARFNTSVVADAATGRNVIKGGGSGLDNTSIYIHTWGSKYGKMIFPQGSAVGITAKDLGEGDAFDSNQARYRALMTMYGWDCGYSLGDWKGVVRIPNIDVSDLTKTGSTGADLVDLIVQGIELLPEEAVATGRVAIYCNRTVRSFLRRQITNKDNVWLSWGEVAGKKVVKFDDFPVRLCESITNAEALVP